MTRAAQVRLSPELEATLEIGRHYLEALHPERGTPTTAAVLEAGLLELSRQACTPEGVRLRRRLTEIKRATPK